MSLRRAISQEYSGPVKNALLALLTGPADWYAAQLRSALSGVEKNDKAVCRIIGAHDKDEIREIASAFERKYGITLKKAITVEIRGNYKRLAVAWVDLIDQLEQPQKRIAIPTKDEVPDNEDPARTSVAMAMRAADDEIDEISEDDEVS